MVKIRLNINYFKINYNFFKIKNIINKNNKIHKEKLKKVKKSK